MWQLHCVLDAVLERADPRVQFARQAVQELGCPTADLEKVVALSLTLLPSDLELMDMQEALAVFERTIPFEWVEDRTQLAGELEPACKGVLQRILAERVQGTLPSAVTAQMLEALRSVLGSSLDPAVLPRLQSVIQEELVQQMWRSLDVASQERLAERLMPTVKSEARLKFGSE